MNADKIHLKVICGPTATGKTAVGALAAGKTGGVVVCADSMQIYRGLEIGTAKPTSQEMGGVEHCVLDFLSPRDSYSAARFVFDAGEAIEKAHSAGKPVYVVGGTGLYISSLIDGIRFVDGAADMSQRERLKKKLKDEGAQALYAHLKTIDPVSAAGIHPNNTIRVLRALEYALQHGEPISAQVSRSRLGEKKYSADVFVLNYSDRGLLYAAIETRVDGMLSRGLLEEARRVFDHREEYGGVLQAIGYKEFFDYFEGKISLGDAVNLLKQRTRNYAKRQLSWFRRIDGAKWLEVDKNTPEQLAELIIF